MGSNAMWIVQDVFSCGTPGPGYTLHETKQDAEREARERDGAVLPLRQCETCESLVGLEGRSLQGGCSYCR